MKSYEIPQPEDRDWRYRAFEILPGALSWSVLALPVVLGIISPRLAAYFVIAYLLLWFVRAIGLDIRSLQGWREMSQHRNAPWSKLIDDLEILQPRTKNAPEWHARNLERVKNNIPAENRIKPSEVYHAIFIAIWNELDVIESTVQSVIDSNYNLKKIILLIAYEQRGGKEVEDAVNALVKKYGKNFYHAETVMHPWPMTGEVIGKGGNVTFAGRRLKVYLEEKKIDPMKVMVTTLDCDNRPDKQYLAALTYTFCSTEDPRRSSYQPNTMYTNNIWDVPAPMRVIATGNSIWNMVLSLRPHMLRNFSSHSQSMAALIDTDFWSSRTIVEDGHQYWRTFFRYDGDYEVYPIFVPIYQDAVLTDSYKRTLKMQFLQVRRWTWGASDIAYVFKYGFMEKNKVPRLKMIGRFLRLLEGHVSWSTAPLLLLLAAYPPLIFHASTFLGNELPQYASALQRVAMVGILVSLFVCFKSLPPKPARYRRHRNVWMVLQWVYLPVTSIVYSSFAAIYSQTRLMFGWYLGWVITEKAVRTDEK